MVYKLEYENRWDGKKKEIIYDSDAEKIFKIAIKMIKEGKIKEVNIKKCNDIFL